MKKNIIIVFLILAAFRTAFTQCTADAGPSGLLTCNDPSVTLQGSSNVSGATYSWTGPLSFSSSTQNPTVTVAGEYTLTITDPSNGCTASSTVFVAEDFLAPTISATGGSISCTPGDLTLNASSNDPGVQYEWTGPNGYFSNNQNPIIPNADENSLGVYIVVVSSPTNGCTAQLAVQVTQDNTFPQINMAVIEPLCFGGNDGAIDLTVTNGLPGYTYQWSNGENIEDLTNLGAGIYNVTVVDANGCTAIQNVVVTEPPPMTVASQVTNVNCNPGTPNGSMEVFVTGGTPPYTYSWNNGSTAQNQTGLDVGTYVVTITDQNGCTDTNFGVVELTTPLEINPNAAICENSITPTTSGGTPPYSYLWSTGSNATTIIDVSPGTYTLTLTDANNCEVSQSFTLLPNTTPCTRITGRVIWDESQDCQGDSAEIGLSNWYLQAVGPNGTFYGISDSSGQYVISVAPGDYTLTLLPLGWQPLICGNDIPVSLPISGATLVTDFLVQLPNADCPALSVDLSTFLLRRCFSTNYYYLNYCNYSPFEAPDAYLTLQLDSFLSVESAELPYTDLGNNTLRFDLGTVASNECENFWVRVSVSCDATLGQTLCSEAHIYPDSLCAPTNPQWTGAHLEVNAQCAGDSLHFILKNVGQGAMGQALDYIVIEDGIMSRQGSATPLQAQEFMLISVPANGATWRFESMQEPYSPGLDRPVLSIEGCSNSGSFSTGFVNQFSLGDEGPWIDLNCTEIIGSYDPNDKQGFPIGYGQDHYIRPGTELEYLIRFQNTGTDTAFTVVIRDTLSSWLDPLSVRAGASSHPYNFQLAGSGTLIFDFQDIMLPDSNINEPESHGFIQFRVSPKSDVPLETDILNQAAIYFDFNDAILTNTTVHRIGENFVSVGLWQPIAPVYAVHIAPHPLQEASWISIDTDPLHATGQLSGDFNLQIIDLTGRPIRNMSNTTPRFLLRKEHMTSGIYLFKIVQDGVLLGTGKLVVL